MVPTIIAGFAGYLLGLLLRFTAFSRKGGAGWVASLAFGVASWIVAVLVLTAYAQTQSGATGSPAWVGTASFFFAGGLFFGMNRQVKV